MPPSVQVQAKKAENQQINTNVQQNQVQNQRNIPQELPQEAAPRERRQARDPFAPVELEMQRLQKEIQLCLQNVTQLYQAKMAAEADYNEKLAAPANTEAEKSQLAESKMILEERENFYRNVVRMLLRLETELGETHMEYTKLYAREAGVRITDDWRDENEEINVDKQIVALMKLQENDWGKTVDVTVKLQDLKNRKNTLVTRRKLRNRLEDTAKGIAEKAKEYRESGFGEGYQEMTAEELLERYLWQAETLWDGGHREKFLSAGFITEHIVQCLSVMDIWKEFQKKRVGFQVPQDKVERLKKADRVMKYYRQHINTVLGDYGMNLGQLTVSQSAINSIVNGERLYGQKHRWEDDYNEYQSLIEKEPDYAGVRERGIGWSESNLRILERRAGISLDTNMDIIQSVYDAKESEKFQERVERNGSTYIRLKADLQLTNGDFQRRINKEARLLAVSKAFIQKLKEEGEWKENSEFAKIPGLFLSYMESYRNNYEQRYSVFEADEEKFRLKLKNTLDRIVLTGEGFREKQYAALIRDYLSFNENGKIVVQCREYQVADKQFTGMGIRRHKDGRSFIDRFRSVKEEALFPHDPVLRDIQQGEMGDCYLIAAIASVVARNPQRIKEMMQDNGNGTVTVQFYNFVGSTSVPLAVTVEKTIPERYYDSLEAKITPYSQGALWVKMIEKAYAALRNKQYKTLEAPQDVLNYETLRGGAYSVALSHLTGVDAELEYDKNFARDIRNFQGRLNSEHMQEIGGRKMNSLSLMYFHQRHMADKDKKVFRYMAGKTGWMWGKDRWKWDAEVSRYQTLEKAMDEMLELSEGQMEIRSMDNGTLSKALGSLLKELEGYLEKLKAYTGHSLKTERLEAAGIPKQLYKPLRSCWKACGQDAKLLQKDLVDMGNLYRSKLDNVRQVVEYTREEEIFYRNIQNILRGGGSCGIGTKNFSKIDASIRGNAGEAYREGMYGEHAYAVLGTQEVTVGNRTRKFLQVFNPHAQTIPIYQIDEKGNLKRTGFKAETDEEKSYEKATHGIFLLELRDARSIVSDIGHSNRY